MRVNEQGWFGYLNWEVIGVEFGGKESERDEVLFLWTRVR